MSVPERVKGGWSLSVGKCPDELVNIPNCDRRNGRGSPPYDCVNQGTGTGFGWGRSVSMQRSNIKAFKSMFETASRNAHTMWLDLA